MNKSNNYQHLVLNTKGVIIQSNDQLFPSEKINHTDSEDLIDFANSILPQIIDLLNVQNSVTFSGVDTSFKLLPGVYDFIFSKNTNSDKSLIDCWIIERTDYYEDIQQFKQNYREAVISQNA